MKRKIMAAAGALVLSLALASQASGQVIVKAMSHDAAGKDNCMMCHAVGVMPPVPDVPADHEGRVNEQCLWCHAVDSPMTTTGASMTGHDTAGKENCLMCHAAGVMPPVPDVPASHEGRENAYCLWCHPKAGG
jgi:hypothetical protein